MTSDDTAKYINAIARAYNVVLSDEQHHAIHALVGHVDARDMQSAVAGLSFRSNFPYSAEWILQAVEVQREQRHRKEILRDKPVARAQYRAISHKITREEVRQITSRYYQSIGEEPLPLPSAPLRPMSDADIIARKQKLLAQFKCLKKKEGEQNAKT